MSPISKRPWLWKHARSKASHGMSVPSNTIDSGGSIVGEVRYHRVPSGGGGGDDDDDDDNDGDDDKG